MTRDVRQFGHPSQEELGSRACKTVISVPGHGFKFALSHVIVPGGGTSGDVTQAFNHLLSFQSSAVFLRLLQKKT